MFPDTTVKQPELLAHHFSEARLNECAVPYWMRAGQHALERVALSEAVNHLNAALTVNSRLGLGRTEQAEALIRGAIEVTEKTGHCMYEAEAHRVLAEVLCARSDPEAAATEFFNALEIAKSQHAKSWELRAATSLARLWRDQGKPEEARELLAPVYGWFTEGFDTLDLQA